MSLPALFLGRNRETNALPCSEYRKPAPGLLFKAVRDLNIDLVHSLFIGDKASDMAAGLAAEMGALLQLGASESITANMNIEGPQSCS